MILAGLVAFTSAFANDTVTVDLSKPRKAISPLIYGVNFPNTGQAAALNTPVCRSGGNATTRYDWQTDATSSAADWYFLSHAGGGTTPSYSADAFIDANRAAGAASMITIPTIGWVAKLKSGFNSSWSFSVAKYGAQQAVEPWNSDAGNGVLSNGNRVTGNDPNDANKPVSISYQQGWIQHLVGKYGTAAAGGVGYYLLDNEPNLWHETHRDVMPTGYRMDDFWTKSRDAASLVKSIDPSALVGGPEEWGWLGYLYSGYDSQWLGNHGWQGTPPDRATHSNMEMSPWLLQKFRQEEINTGKRLLDIFTLHYYPQGNYGDSTASDAQDWRNRCTRSLWDTNYTDESWIGQKIYLIPRMKQWVNTYYPGTKIGVTEYNFGAEDHISGAIAQADALGIFGREGLDLATRWTTPSSSSVSFKAIQMYRNYDGQKSTFGPSYVSTTVVNPDNLAAYSSLGNPDGTLRVMLIHKRRTGTATVDVNVPFGTLAGKASVYQLRSTNVITKLADIAPVNKRITITVPSQSITLLVIKTAVAKKLPPNEAMP